MYANPSGHFEILATIAVGAAAGVLTSVTAGMAARGLDSLITSAEEDRNILETASQFAEDVLNPEDVAKDAIIGGATAGITYEANASLSKTIDKVKQTKKNLCEKTPNIEKKTVTTENSTVKVSVDIANGGGEDGIYSVAKSNQGQGFSSKGYSPQLGERTFEGYVNKNVPGDVETKLFTHSSGFNTNPKNGSVTVPGVKEKM